MYTYKSFETKRLVLKITSEEDAPFLLELLNTPTWLQYIGDRKVRTMEDAKNYIKTRMQPQLEKLGYANYTIILKSTNEKLGVCGLYDRAGLEGIDLGFALLPAHERKGYAFEAAQEILRAAVEEFGLRQLRAITTKENKASQKLLEKLNFKFTKTVQLPNDDEELLLYELATKKA